MRKKFALLSLASAVCVGCGASGTGFDSTGLYTLSLSLTSSAIDSPSVVIGTSGYPEIPPDTVEGTVRLVYDGTFQPLKASIKEAKVCIASTCYPLPVSGVLEAGTDLTFSANLTLHKYDPPWVVINPYEDEVYATNKLTASISSTDGLTYRYTLPLSYRDPNAGQIVYSYGSPIAVYDGTTLLCTDTAPADCTITVNGNDVTVTFTNPQASPLTIEYTEIAKVDFNPSIDASALGHLWNGQGAQSVSGSVEVSVELEDGTKLTASVPVVFFARP